MKTNQTTTLLPCLKMGDNNDTPVTRGGERKALQRKASRKLFSQEPEDRGAPAPKVDMPSESLLGARRKTKAKSQQGVRVNLPEFHRADKPRKPLTK